VNKKIEEKYILLKNRALKIDEQKYFLCVNSSSLSRYIHQASRYQMKAKTSHGG
jgi:hypothetical protein